MAIKIQKDQVADRQEIAKINKWLDMIEEDLNKFKILLKKYLLRAAA